ncbi:MAG: gamma-glutamyltransferase [gamma proteobacterium symbiont of Phacoides pectinatus]
MNNRHGIVAAGHPVTAGAAAEVLKAGGNAFDAALAAIFASCVAEPVLASLGGGGVLMAHQYSGKTQLYDFFVQTPKRKLPQESIDFYPILADFGTAQQEFHIGLGSIATPGVIRGLFAVHRDLCRMPLRAIIEPACEAARNGVEVNSFQHYISDIISPIITANASSLALHESPSQPGNIAMEGERLTQPDMADAFESLAREGEALFYLGEMGRPLLHACDGSGGCLGPEDLEAYQVIRRPPLTLKYHTAELATNPAPSVGGTLIAFALALLEQERLGQWPANSHEHLLRITKAQALTQLLRGERGVDRDLDEHTSREILGREYLRDYRRIIRDHSAFSRGTTHISIADSAGNVASMTLSNGEGSGYVLPGTGIMLNNMLGEEDINPHGFHQWPEDRRIASMMAPTMIFTPHGGTLVTGSGGSNRIRSAVLQVLVNLVDFGMDIADAVEQPRIHFEGGVLNMENGPTPEVCQQLQQTFPQQRIWPEKNLFFGGAHSVMIDADGTLSGKGDSRRGGVCIAS